MNVIYAHVYAFFTNAETRSVLGKFEILDRRDPRAAEELEGESAGEE